MILMEKFIPTNPQKFNSVYSKRLVLFFTVVLFIALVVVLAQYITLNKVIGDRQQRIKLLEQTVKQKDHEIDLFIKDMGERRGGVTKEPYSFKALGVYSPQFIGKEVDTMTYWHGGLTTYKHILSVDNIEGVGHVMVNVWDLPLKNPIKDEYTIFVATENNDLVYPIRFTSELLKQYGSVSLKNIPKMYWGVDRSKTITSVKLSLLYTPIGQSQLIELVYDTGETSYQTFGNQPEFLVAKKALTDLANTLSLRPQ